MALALSITAPVAVVLCLVVWRSVWLTILVYQVGICLLAPAVDSLVGRRLSWAQYLRLLGLTGPGQRAGLRLGAFLAVVTFAVTAGFLMLTREVFLDPERLAAITHGWGISTRHVPWLLAVLVVLNAPAEELFWRGYLHTRLVPPASDGTASAAAGRGARRNVATWVVIALLAVGYASYHALTVGRLVPTAGSAALMFGGILAAGLLWGWLRQRSGSVWPALLGHWGAVAAYAAVYQQIVIP
jgi:membrane protease YdiL (CAAX protease family)